jgi:hypothetical protein
MDFSALVKLRKHLTIKHHIPGRLRFLFDAGLIARAGELRALANGNGLPPGVSDARLNILARSVILEYDAQRVPMELLERLITAPADADALAALEELKRRVGYAPGA